MFDPSWNSAQQQIEQGRDRIALKARIAEVQAQIRSPDCQETGRLLDLLDLLQHRLDALGDDPPV